ncbi:hypothetical protein Dimus_024976 [Dionaea muscipula]
MEKQRSFFAPGQMRRIYASKCAGDLSQRNSSCNRPDSLKCTNYDQVARSCTDEELMDLVEFERRGSIYSADSIHHAPYEGGKDGNPPTLETMYFETRKTKNKILEEAAARKYWAMKPKDLEVHNQVEAELMTKFQQQRDEDATTFTNRIDEQQKYINELHVDHQRAMDELKDDHRREMNTVQAEMRMLKQLVLQGHGYSTSLPIDS